MATIRDVAREAGVSLATVSRVLAKPDLVSQGMRERVMVVINRLGYTPDPVAVSLKTRRTGKILVTLPDISNPFFATVIRGVEEAAGEGGYSVVLGNTRNERDREEQYGRMLVRREVDGLIFLGHRLPDILVDVVKAGRGAAPIVNGCEFDPALGVSSTHIDNERAAAAAIDLLCEAGHRHIAAITGPIDSPISRNRIAGVRSAAERNHIVGSLAIATGDFSVESGRREAAILLRKPDRPTAIFCFSDEMAIGALAAIRAANLACPADVSVIGFDDIQVARYVDPPLTTIRQPMHLIGRSTAELLIATLRGECVRPETVTLEYQVIMRQSVAPA